VVKRPFSTRRSADRQRDFLVLREDVPDGLRASLLEWTMRQFTISDRFLTPQLDQRKLGILERLTDRTILSGELRDYLPSLEQAFSEDDHLHLDAVDVALGFARIDDVVILETYLREARSAYCVGEDFAQRYELQYRQSEEMTRLLANETSQHDQAATHLRTAWSRCFGRKPQTNDVCMEAVKSIEIAAKPVVTPNDPNATLGKMCAAIRSKPDKWETDSEFDGGVNTVLAMMEMVWKGHLRHGHESAPLEVSQEATEMTVQTAVLLVSWFRSGRIRLRPQPRMRDSVRAGR